MSVRTLRPTESIDRMIPLDVLGNPQFGEIPIFVFNLDEDPSGYADENGYITFAGNGFTYRCRLQYVAEPTEICGRLILPGVWLMVSDP